MMIMTTIFLRFKSLLTLGLIVLSISFVWFALTSGYQGKNFLAEDEHPAMLEETEGDRLEPEEVSTQPQITIISEEEKELKDNFFSEYRLERERTRSERVERLNEIINNPNSSEDIRLKAQEELLWFTNNIGKETKIENALLAKGFTDVISVIEKESVMVVVPSEGLRDDEIARIADIVTMISGCKMEDVVIVPKA
ncbi:MAG: SpoIIIAH-like family protein [Clostridia bacterium]|jgi:stage III sporulation protein AH|nr:SpoIIIAH-like family protein [Clostridia bacterium]